MALNYKSVSVHIDIHERIAKAAAEYSKQIGVKVSIAKFIEKMLIDWEKDNK